MTPQEVKAICLKMAKEIGPRGKVWCRINMENEDGTIEFTVYDNWPMGETKLKVSAEDFATGVANLKAKWSAYQDQYRRDRVKKMALKIIEITALHGECTDAALRGCWEFDDRQITAFGADACEEANRMAANGPFSIVVKVGANGAPGLEDEAA